MAAANGHVELLQRLIDLGAVRIYTLPYFVRCFVTNLNIKKNYSLAITPSAICASFCDLINNLISFPKSHRL